MREEPEIVFQRDQVILRDLRIRRIGILDIDRPIPERFVAETVVDPLEILRGQLVTRGQRSPAVASIEKLVRQAELQLRMRAQIADRSNVASRGGVASHDQRVSVVEAEFIGNPDAESGEFSPKRLERNNARRFQNLFGDRPGVFGIERDLAGAERFPENDRSAHSLAVLRVEASGL